MDLQREERLGFRETLDAPMSSEYGTYKTVKARYTTVKASYKTVKARYKTVKARYKTVKARYKTVKAIYRVVEDAQPRPQLLFQAFAV